MNLLYCTEINLATKKYSERKGGTGMKIELGRCLLHERLLESSMTREQLAGALKYKPERLSDFIENKRVMPLQVAISISNTIGCEVKELYEILLDGSSV
jgi:hypothetical protein